MNYVWFALVAIAVIVGAVTGHMQDVTNAAMDSAKTAVEIAIGLIGVMALWLGLMRIAEKAGLVRAISRLLKPVMIRLFPEVPSDHPAMGSMIANIAANMLGLGNSATALGLKAMKDLQEINVDKSSASNAMATFLAINTSSVTLIPATVIAVRVAAGSTAPAEIIGPTLVATGASTIVAIIASRLLQRTVPAQKPGGNGDNGIENSGANDQQPESSDSNAPTGEA